MEYKVKVYPKEEGADKVTGLVTYFRPESVPLAINLLDETEFKPGCVIKVAEVRLREHFYQIYFSLQKWTSTPLLILAKHINIPK